MNAGIVGHEAAKFTPTTEAAARHIIRLLLQPPQTVLVSGHCHLGGIDIWAEEEADKLHCPKQIFPPKIHDWRAGYKPRNILIAQYSDTLHNIVISEYPPTYTGMKFKYCYHCNTDLHVKSGGCWTAKYAARLGKPIYIYVIHPNGTWDNL